VRESRSITKTCSNSGAKMLLFKVT